MTQQQQQSHTATATATVTAIAIAIAIATVVHHDPQYRIHLPGDTPWGGLEVMTLSMTALSMGEDSS